MSYLPELTQYEENNKELSPSSSVGSTPASGTKNSKITADGKNGGIGEGKQKHGRRAARACKSCHSLKVKCTPADENSPNGPCMRCVNSKRKCEIDPNQTRKRRKKAEMYEANSNSSSSIQEKTIHELQEQVKKLKQQLDMQLQYGSEASPLTSSIGNLDSEITVLRDFNTSKLTLMSNTLRDTADRRNSLMRASESWDIIKSGLITIDEARERFEIFKSRLIEPYYFVHIPRDMTIEELRESQPFLFLGIMSVTNTIYTKSTDLNVTLAIDNAAIQSIVLEVLVVGSKSVELIKTLILLCLWYNTPELFKNRRNHLLNTLSVSMLHDLGFVGRPFLGYDSSSNATNSEFGNIEFSRLIVTLYFSTVCICITLRRRIYVKWTPQVEESCVSLENSTNKEHVRVALFLRLSQQLEQIYLVVHAPDFSEKKPSFSKYIVRGVQNKLNEIKAKISPDDHVFLGYFYTVEAYLYEPIFGNILDSDKGITDTLFQVDAMRNLNNCVTACLNALDEFNKLSINSVATLPLVYASRIIYTVGILLKLRYLMLSIPSLHDKGLVPDNIIFTIQCLTNLIDQSTIVHPFNHILKKTRLVLQLFIQAYASQIQELFRKKADHQNSRNNMGYSGKDFSEIEGLTRLFKKSGSVSASNGIDYHAQVPLDILSYAASYRKSFPNQPDFADHRNSQSVPPIESSRQPLTSSIPQNYSSSDLNATEGMNNMNPNFNNNSNATPAAPNPVNLSLLLKDNSMQTSGTDPSQTRTMNMDSVNNLGNSVPLANPDQLENLYDEFWSDLINTDADKINFSNYSNKNAPVYDDVFFMP